MIFERFTQADSAITRKYGGSGLGLAISQELVTRMGGRIWVDSLPGQGSRFYFTARFENSDSDLIPSSPGHAFHGQRVLIVDDNEATRLILTLMLNKIGADAQPASGPEEGLALLTESAENRRLFSIVFMEHHMPEKGGRSLTWHIRADRRFDRTKLVLITNVIEEEAQSMLDRGLLNAILLKPVKRAELERVLDAVGTPPPKAIDPGRPPATGEPRPMNILLVEDNEDNRLLIHNYLKKTIHLVTAAVNGQEAVEQCASGRFQLVLMDMRMPVMDGYTATAKIREMEREQHVEHIPIVALTADAMPEDIDKSLAAGCDEHMSKPIKKKALMEMVNRYAARSEELHERGYDSRS